MLVALLNWRQRLRAGHKSQSLLFSMSSKVRNGRLRAIQRDDGLDKEVGPKNGVDDLKAWLVRDLEKRGRGRSDRCPCF